jgi:DNA-directed RNA polymerase subunit beta'
MLRTTVGAVLVNRHLPPDLRDFNRVLDKKGIEELFQEVAERHPDKYVDISKRLSDVGRDVAYQTGGFSFGLADMEPSEAAQRTRAQIERDVQLIHARGDLNDAAKEKAIVATVGAHQKPLQDAILAEADAKGNPLAQQIRSGARGNPMNLKSLLGADLLYTDHHNREIPIPVLNPYPQGLSPVQYWAGAFGARKGVWDTKHATQEAGYFAKQLVQAAHRLVVAGPDDEEEPDPYTVRGLPVEVDDPDNVGAFLAHPAGAYKRNTQLTPRVLKDLKASGIRRILVRSPLVGGPPLGGVYARDVGIRERGFLPRPNDFVGIAAAQALAEKLTQGQLSSKHAGGVAGADRSVTGFKFINQLVQTPRVFKGGATHAQRDGVVSAVREAPQGGHYVDVAGEEHYVQHGHDVLVAPGDRIEAGDVLSEGTPNPAEIVQHKGIGEGMRHFTNAFIAAYRRSGMAVNRRNVELLSRGLINHVRVTDEFGDHIEDDIVPYSHVERTWEPREGARVVAPNSATGKYLERPVLHHTIGTRVKPGMLPELEEFGITHLHVHDDPPPFEPVMIRGMATLASDPDWMTRHLGSGLQKSTLEAVHRGRASDEAGTSYVPALARRVDFGRRGLTQGWKAPKDADSDGYIHDGTPRQRPAPASGPRHL